MKGIGLGIGLSLVLWGIPAWAENWQTVTTSIDGAVTEIDFDTIERRGRFAFHVQRKFLPRPTHQGVQVYVAEMETDCQQREERFHQLASYTLDGKRLAYQKQIYPWQPILTHSVAEQVYNTVCQ